MKKQISSEKSASLVRFFTLKYCFFRVRFSVHLYTTRESRLGDIFSYQGVAHEEAD